MRPTRVPNSKQRLLLTKDLYRRKKIMEKRYTYQQLRQLTEQYGFKNTNDPRLIEALVPLKDNPPEKHFDFKESESGDKDSLNIQKRKNRHPQQLISHPDDVKFSKDGTPIGGEVKFDMIRASQYRDITKLNNTERDMEHPVLVIPEPTEEEISTGFMYRYFLQQANSPTAPIIEIDKEQYEGYLKIGGGIDRTFYSGTVMKWRIRGRLETIKGDDGIIRKGVLEGNNASIEFASQELPALKTQLNNLVKYWSR